MATPGPTDREVQRQLLLTRIALERGELRREVDQLRAATSLPPLAKTLLRSAFGVPPRPTGATGADGWLETALAWLRRYRLASAALGTVFGAAAPTLGRRLRWKRLALFAALGGAAWWGWATKAGPERRTPPG